MITKLARHTIALSIKYDEDVKLFDLSRILFFAVGIMIKQGTEEEVKYIKDNYHEEFAKWRYGAVPVEVYNHIVKVYGSWYRLTRGGKYYEELKMFDRVLVKLMKADSRNMIALNRAMASHKMWEERINYGMTVPNWTFEEIEYEFKQLRGTI